MSLKLSTEYANAYLDYLLGKRATLPAVEEVWLALGNITDGVFAEISGNGYGRELVSIVGQDYPYKVNNAVGGSINNYDQLKFNKATADYSVNAIALYTERNGGTPFATGYLTGANTTVNVVAGALPMFEINGFGLSMEC